jgi:hypothetical protein
MADISPMWPTASHEICSTRSSPDRVGCGRSGLTGVSDDATVVSAIAYSAPVPFTFDVIVVSRSHPIA